MYTIKKPKIDFNEEKHQYSIGNQIVPSVSQILGATVLKGKYAGINMAVLNKAAQFGTNVHKAIEIGSAEGLTPEEQHCYMQWLRIKRDDNIEELAQETMIAFWNNRTETWDFCGTFDLIGLFDGVPGIGDFKTTSQLDRVQLSWQMSLYSMPLRHYPEWYEDVLGDYEIETLRGIWLPKKRNGRHIVAEMKDDEQLYDLLEEYYSKHPREYLEESKPKKKPRKVQTENTGRYKRKRFGVR